MPRAACEIRRALTEDFAAVLQVHIDHGGRSPGPPTRRERDTWSRMMQQPGLEVYVACLNGEVIGTATLMMMPNLGYDCAPTAFIEPIVVTPTHRRHGVATHLLQHLLVQAGQRGCDKIQLLSHRRHATDGAHDLYRKVGFVDEAAGFRRYLRGSPRAGRAPRSLSES